MKKISILTIIILLVFCSCRTAPKEQQEVFEPSLKSPNKKIGEVEMQFDKAFPLPGIRKIDVTVLYFPVEDAVCLRWRMNLMTYYQFWSYKGREAFAKNLEKYKIDFEEKNFGRSSRKTRRKYGSAEGYLIWQAASFTLQAKWPNVVDFGYYFVDRVPYYTVTQKELYYEDELARDNNRRLSEMPMYFTRAQADNLAALFDPEFIASILHDIQSDSSEVEIDEYD